MSKAEYWYYRNSWRIEKDIAKIREEENEGRVFFGHLQYLDDHPKAFREQGVLIPEKFHKIHGKIRPFGEGRASIKEEPAKASYEDIRELATIRIGNEEDLLRLVHKLGTFTWELPYGTFVRREWEEISDLASAAWLLETLYKDPRDIRPYAGLRADDLFLVAKPDRFCPDHFQDHQRAFNVMGSDPVEVAFHALAFTVKEGLRRCNAIAGVELDNFTFTRNPGMAHTVAGAFWELLAREMCDRKFPIVCPICGDLVQRERSTRKFCRKSACRKAAQRLREKEQDRE